MKSLIAVPFLIGSLPILGSVAIGYNYLKSKKDNKFLYWGGLTASAFVGWSLSTMLYIKYGESVAKSVILGAETWTEDNVCLKCNSPFGDCSCERCPQCDEFWNDRWLNCDDCFSCDDCCRESCPHLWEAEGKYIKPYDGKKGLDFKRGNDGKFRRRLSVPLKKDAESTVVKPSMNNKMIHSSRAFSQEHLINWMKYMSGDISKQATKLIRLDYKQCADLVDSQGYDTGATPDDCWSSYPTMQSTPEIYSLPYDPLCLRVMEQDYYESDGHYFSDDSIIFYNDIKDSKGRPFEILFVYQCAMVPQTDGQIRPQRYNHDHELKKEAESDGWFSVSFTSNEKQANTDKKGFEDGDVGFGFVDSYSDYRYKIMENSDKQGWTVLAQRKNN